MTRTALLPLLLLAALGALSLAQDQRHVTVRFLAEYDLIEHTLDDFTKQFKVMMYRTGAVEDADVLSISITKSARGNILAIVELTDADAAVRLTDAVLGRHLSVYVGGVGFIGVIDSDEPQPKEPDTPPPSTNAPTAVPPNPTDLPTTTAIPLPPPSPPPPSVTERPLQSTKQPTTRGFVWLNEYTSDNENINDCSAGHVWSGLVVSRMPIGCHRFQHAQTKQDEFNFLQLNGDGSAKRFGMICDSECTSCISQQENLEVNTCVETWGGSVAVYPPERFCIGAAYIELDEGALTIMRFGEAGCDLESSPSQTLYMRNYPPAAYMGNATCRRDGSRGKFYMLAKVVDGEGRVHYDGVLDCDDDACSEGCTKVDQWQEEQCHRDPETGAGVMIAPAVDALSVCASDTDGNVAQDPLVSAVDESGVAGARFAAAGIETAVPAEPAVNNVTSSTVVTDLEANMTPTESTQVRIETRTSNPRIDVSDSSGADADSAQDDNKHMAGVMIAAGCVMAVAFITVGAIYRRRVVGVAPGYNELNQEDEYYDYDGYDYDGYDGAHYDDDRLIQEI